MVVHSCKATLTSGCLSVYSFKACSVNILIGLFLRYDKTKIINWFYFSKEVPGFPNPTLHLFLFPLLVPSYPDGRMPFFSILAFRPPSTGHAVTARRLQRHCKAVCSNTANLYAATLQTCMQQRCKPVCSAAATCVQRVCNLCAVSLQPVCSDRAACMQPAQSLHSPKQSLGRLKLGKGQSPHRTRCSKD